MKEMGMIDWRRMWNEDPSVRRFSPARAALFLFSLVYRGAVAIRNRRYDKGALPSAALDRPVVSVGNLTVGGTGKTPCVIALAGMLRRRGYQPAVISRGYGGKSAAPVTVVSDGTNILCDAATAGDEPLLIAQSLPGVPVITGPRRILTGRAAIDRFGCDVLICDDAFQHRQIRRDIDIVLLDAQRPFGNGYLLPRGELREPAESLARASCLLLTRSDSGAPVHPDAARIAREFGIPVFRAAHRFTRFAGPEGQSLAPGELAGKKICAFCGIARPESFKKMLAETGAEILSFIDFPDHYAYNRSDLAALEKHFAAQNSAYRITTEKDAMRLAAYPDFLKTVFVARMEMEIAPSVPSFEEFIIGKMGNGEW